MINYGGIFLGNTTYGKLKNNDFFLNTSKSRTQKPSRLLVGRLKDTSMGCSSPAFPNRRSADFLPVRKHSGATNNELLAKFVRTTCTMHVSDSEITMK